MHPKWWSKCLGDIELSYNVLFLVATLHSCHSQQFCLERDSVLLCCHIGRCQRQVSAVGVLLRLPFFNVGQVAPPFVVA